MIPHRRRRGPLQQVWQEDLGHQHGAAAAPEHRAPRGQHRHVPHGRHHAGQGRAADGPDPAARTGTARAARADRRTGRPPSGRSQPAQERPVARAWCGSTMVWAKMAGTSSQMSSTSRSDGRHGPDQADGPPFIAKRPLERLGKLLDAELLGAAISRAVSEPSPVTQRRRLKGMSASNGNAPRHAPVRGVRYSESLMRGPAGRMRAACRRGQLQKASTSST